MVPVGGGPVATGDFAWDSMPSSLRRRLSRDKTVGLRYRIVGNQTYVHRILALDADNACIHGTCRLTVADIAHN